MPPKMSHPHHPHPHLTIHPHHLLRSRRCWRRPHLLRKLLWRSFQIPAGRRHHHLHLRNRTCRWLTSPLLRRSSSMQALSLALWSPAALRLPSPQLLACPRLLRQLHLLVLDQNLWPGSHRRTQWASTAGLQGGFGHASGHTLAPADGPASLCGCFHRDSEPFSGFIGPSEASAKSPVWARQPSDCSLLWAPCCRPTQGL